MCSGEARLWLYRQVGQIAATVTPPHVGRRDADDDRRLGDFAEPDLRSWSAASETDLACP
jgi:hypothetical protein